MVGSKALAESMLHTVQDTTAYTRECTFAEMDAIPLCHDAQTGAGSDWPTTNPNRRIADFEKAPFKYKARAPGYNEDALWMQGETDG